MRFLLLLSLAAIALAHSPRGHVPKTLIESEVPQTRIGGGVPAAAGEFTYQASIRVGGFHICSGVIIAPQFLLTAASCVVGQSERLLEVKFGSHDRKNGGTVVGVSRVIVHEHFHRTSITNDIALVQISGRFTGITAANLAVLSDISLVEAGIEVEFAGWGVSGITSGELAGALQKAQSQVVDIEVCARGYKDLIPMQDHLADVPSRFCVGSSKHGVLATCAGDAGGAAFVKTRFSGNKVVGIASFSADCGTNEAHPSVFTFVGVYTQWIDNRIEECLQAAKQAALARAHLM